MNALSFAQQLMSAYPFTPTAEQQQFCVQMQTFLNAEDAEKCFVLKGYAGTGKTTSVAALVKALSKINLKSVLLAPTGRAAKVMSQYTGKKALTIHKRIYRKKSSTAPEMDFQKAPNLAKNTIFIVDEASMLSASWTARGSSLLEDLIDHVYVPGSDCYLMLVGDTAQLPPIGMTESLALDAKYLSAQSHLKVFQWELKEVVRQARESGILLNATQLRVDILENKEAPMPQLSTKAYKDVFRMTGMKMVEGLEYAYHKFGMENTLVVCRSNKSANIYNEQIRARLLYREANITGGDHIMVVRNNYFWLPENEETSFIANGDMARVIRVRNEEERYGFTFADLNLELIDYPNLGELSCKVMLDTLHLESPNLPYEANKKLYEQLQLDYAHISNSRARLQAIKEDPYFNALQIKFSYAVTCHKAQGGQWDAVFVDQGYLTEEMLNTEFLRWLYTAITRAKKELFFVNFAASLFAEPAETD